MFILTQFIGLYVINFYLQPQNPLPFGMDSQTQVPIQCSLNSISDFFICTQFLPSLLLAFVFAILIFFFLTKYKISFLLRFWFFVVVLLSLSLSFYAIIPNSKNLSIFILILSGFLGFLKIYKKNILIHNLTEFLVYPGIAAVFIPLLNFWSVIVLLILISLYDMWAVWKSGIMQKMAKYQINNLKVFSGFFIPYLPKKLKNKLKKSKKNSKKKIKVNVAILGGGDVVFPIITAGVILKTFGLIPALFTIFGATIGLFVLFVFAEKRKFYPAMPFITAGMFLFLLVRWVFF